MDKKWANNFVLELRMLDVEGRRIGAALSEGAATMMFIPVVTVLLLAMDLVIHYLSGK